MVWSSISAAGASSTTFEWQSRAVMARHVRLYFSDWPIKVLPPALEPVTMLTAFGLGLGAYMSAIEWRGREVSYLSFVAPGRSRTRRS